MTRLWCVFVFVFLQTQMVQCAYESKTYYRIVLQGNQKSDFSPLRETSTSTVIMCAARCLREPGCYYIGYERVSCVMFSKPPSESPGQPGVRYYARCEQMGSTFDNTHSKIEFEDTCKTTRGYIYASNPLLCYKLSDYERNYHGSGKVCKRTNGRLIILSQDDIFDFILHDIGKEYMKVEIWVGMWVSANGQCVWSDGTTHVKRWTEGRKPDTRNDCVYLAINPTIASSGLRDGPCHAKKQFLCEIPNT